MDTIRKHAQTLWALLLVTLLGSPLITPLLRWTAVPCTHDGHLHYHRVAAMRYAWEQGLAFTRWLPDLAFGYGYPFFVYREPTPLYAVLLPHLLGLPLPAASNLFYALCILGGGWFMFLWVRDVLDARAGVLAAVAYMAAPYMLIDVLVRGNAPESLALALLPLLLWMGRRWLLTGTAVSFTVAVFSLAFFALSHNISLLIFTPTLLVYLLVVGRVRRVAWRTLLLRLLLLFGLGLGMTAFYAGGALLELNSVTLEQSTVTRNNDFRFNFASLAEIFAPVSPEDPNLLNAPLLIRLGWAPLALALFGVWRGLRGKFAHEAHAELRAELRAHVWLMLAGTAVYLAMALSLSRPLWEFVPLIDFVQFPWRFVGRAALPLAFLAGLAVAQTENGKRETGNGKRKTAYGLPLTAVLLTGIALLIVETGPNLYPNVCREEPFPTINTVHAYEHETGLVGVDPEGSYFPRTVLRRPKESALETDYVQERSPRRFDTAVLPPGAAIERIEYAPLGATVDITSPEPFTARYLSFDFPGWTATVNGAPAPITPSDPDGLITFPVPAGSSTIEVRWQSTPLRSLLLGVSLMALAGAVLTAVLLRTHQQSALPTPAPPPRPRKRFPLPWRSLLLLSLALLAGKLLLDRVETPLRRAAPPDVAVPTALQAGELRLDGYTLSQQTVAGGAPFDIHLAWTTVAAPAANYQSNVWLRGPDGLVWSDKETYRPRLHEDAPPSIFWQPGQWHWDSREVTVFSGTPPGAYDIVLTLFDLETLAPLTLRDANGTAVGPTAVIGTITVTQPPTPPAFTPQISRTAELPAVGLRLLGFSQDRETAVPGEGVLLTWFWERLEGAAAETVTLALVDANEQIVQTWMLPAVQVGFDANAWQGGARLRSQQLVRPGAGLASGDYRFVLEGVPLGEITVVAPARALTPPPMATDVNAPLRRDGETAVGETAVLLSGYTVQKTADQLTLELVWQGAAEMAISYRVFVHLVDAAGNIVAQSDAEPAAWTRPTTGWAVGEYVVDAHTLALPADFAPAVYALRVGLYDPDTGLRLQTETADYVPIPLQE